MSMDISPAYRLKSKSYAVINKLINELRIELKEKAIELAMKELARRAVMVLDEFTLGTRKPSGDKSPASVAWTEFSAEVKDTITKRERNPRSDMAFTMALMLYKGSFYAILYTEQQEFIKAFERKVPSEDFSYWNGSDEQLKTLTMRQWNARGKTWDKILSNTSVPSMNGASFDLVLPTRWLPEGMYKKIHEHAPDLESRVKHHALENAIHRLVEKRGGLTDEVQKDWHEAIRFYNSALWDIKEGLEAQDPEITALTGKTLQKCLPSLAY